MNSRSLALLGAHDRITRAVPRDPDAVDVRALLRLFWKNKWRILAAMVLAGLVAWAATRQIAPSYTSTAKLLLDPRKTDVLVSEAVLSAVDPSQEVLNGEIATLRSNILIEDVIRAIGPETLAPIDPALAAPGVVARLAAALDERFALGLVSMLGVEPPGPVTEAERMEGLVWAVGEAMTVYGEQNSYVIVVQVDTVSADLAHALAVTVVDRYLVRQAEGRRQAVGGALGWMEGQLTALRAALERAETEVEQYKAESLLREGATMDALSGQLGELNRQLITARSERLAAEALVAQIEALVEAEGIDQATRTVTTLPIQTLRAQIAALRQQDAVWARNFPPDHPRRIQIASEIASIEVNITHEVQQLIDMRRSEAEIARLNETSLIDSIAQTQTRIMAMTRDELELRQLEREAGSARVSYEALLGRVTDVRMQQQLQQPEARLIARPDLPTQPSAPRPKLMGALGGAVGACLMAVLVFFREMTATTFRTAREIEAESGIPVLAVLPKERWRSNAAGLKALRRDPNSIYAERIRQLRTSVLMRDEAVISQSVLLMSSASDEGTTMTTLALAEMSAMAGLEVIVVDCDLRHSTIRRVLGGDTGVDFADYILGNCTLFDAIRSTEAAPYDVLAARGSRSDAAELLSVARLAPMIAELKLLYDVVLIDSPALLAVADALIPAQVVDARLYVVEYDTTPRQVVLDGLALLSDMRLSVNGIILNKVDPRRGHDPYAAGYSY